MRFLVLGAGATGGYFGGRLAEAGVDVTFLVRPARAEVLACEGLRIESPMGNLVRTVATTTPDQVRPGYDVVLLSCKAYDLASALDAIGPAMGQTTCVLPLLNGMRHLEILDAVFGLPRVLGGTCHISVTLGNDGLISHTTPSHQSLTYGQRHKAQKEICQDLSAAFAAANFETRLSDSITAAMWEKWTFLTALAAMTASMRATVGEISRSVYGARLMLMTFEECCAVAQASGFGLASDTNVRMQEFLTDPKSQIAASMLHDLNGGKRIEADHIVGDFIRRGDLLNIPTPNLVRAYAALDVYQRRLLDSCNR